jgi:hypothetical protein
VSIQRQTVSKSGEDHSGNPVRGQGLSQLESQELNLLDQDRFRPISLTDSDPVSTTLSI